MKKLRSSTRQQGISLVESIVTLGIMSAVAVGTLFMSTQYTEDTRTAGAAEHMRVIAEATRLYVRDHRAALIAQATPTKPVLLTTSALATAGYLPAGYSLRNAFDQNVCALVLEPSTGVLNGLVVAEGGQALDDVTLAHFSSLIGAGGGGRFTVNSDSLQGAGGAWTMPLAAFNGLPNSLGFRCNGTTPGAVQISIGTPVYAQWLNGTDTADPGFLSRDVVPGNPGANTMQTTLNLGGNRISNLNTVTIGAGCGAGVTDGELSSGPGGEVVSCVSGVWTAPGKAYWGATVGTFSALPGCAASNLGETRRVTDITGVFVCDGLRWDAALNTSNNLSLPQHLRVAGNATVAGNARINGTTNLYGATTAHAALNANAGVNVGSGQSVHGTGSMQVETTGNLYLKPWAPAGQVIVGGSGGSGNLSASGSVQASNRLIAGTRVVAGEYLQINGIASEGAGCAPNGLTGRTSSGALLSCQSGVWKKLGGTPSSCVLHPIPTYYTESARTYQCPSGYVMKGSRYYYWKNGVQTQTHLVCCN